MRNFKELKVWQKGMDLAVDIYFLAGLLPADERFGLKSQLSRAAVSIPSNIAEGSSRSSDKEYKRYVEFALGSSFELETQLLLIQRLAMIEGVELEEALQLIAEEQRMLSGFINTLRC